MSEFSREYYEAKKDFDSTFDFCYFEIFKELKESEIVNEICEGFGSIGIARIKNQPQLLFKVNGVIEYKHLFDIVGA